MPSCIARTMGLVVGLTMSAVGAPSPCLSQSGPKVAIPDNTAGRVLSAWLDAFDSGDSTRLKAYYATHQPDALANDYMAFRNQTGGFDLLTVGKSDARHIEFTVKERNSPRVAYGVIDLAAGDPVRVKAAPLLAIPNGTTAADFTIDAAERSSVIDGAIQELSEYYVYPEIATRMADSVRARQQRGDYDPISNGITFAGALTDDFQAVSKDRHLRVTFSPGKLPEPSATPSPEAEARNRRQLESINCGFVRVEQLPGNVGYLKFNMFADPAVCGPTAAAAMSFVANSSALIIDLRDNGGGDPKMVTYLCSYLFSAATHVNDLWNRKTGATQEYWTDPNVPGQHFGGSKPVYVLTAKRTFSGAEEFSYDLKNQKRAILVGETTGGGAHPVAGRRIDDHFIIGVPAERAINPVTKTDWEGVGVEPDVKVAAVDALATAQKLAAAEIARRR